MSQETYELTQSLERKLDSFAPDERRQALDALINEAEAGRIRLPEPGQDVNMHCHTFFSFNTYGYSPTKFAWLARKHGLAAAGTVDFDVLDAIEEFHEARRKLGLKGCSGLETRVYVPEFADKGLTSPGEPGITYHMGVGFPTARLEGPLAEFQRTLKDTAQRRNQDLMARVNAYLSPVELDYEKDVLTLTPKGNATERHMCTAYARKARATFGDGSRLAAFWGEKLGADPGKLELPDGRTLLDTIRKKTMKQGGVGYVRPDTGSFPRMAETNRFIAACGAIPTLTWLDGTSEGERQIEALLKVAMETGVAVVNIVPDRNYTPGARDEKLRNLYEVVDICRRLDLSIIVGTEMNSPGQRFVDDFSTDELGPLLPIFLEGAYIFYAHTVLQQQCALGYVSRWAAKHFPKRRPRNAFFHRVGRALRVEDEDKLATLNSTMSPQEVLKAAGV